jgi:hypothetical protein
MEVSEMRKVPAFISLVGVSEETDRLFEKLKYDVPTYFGNLNCEFLETPFKDSSNMKIGDRKKRGFPPRARICFRWGLFIDFNETKVKPVFDAGPDIVIIREFGYGLYAGAVEYADCDRSLAIHEALVTFGVLELGICPPLYVFTEPLTDRQLMLKKRYFSNPKQRATALDSIATLPEKVDFVIGAVHGELSRPKPKFAHVA